MIKGEPQLIFHPTVELARYVLLFLFLLLQREGKLAITASKS